MSHIKNTLNSICSTMPGLVFTSSAFAAEQTAAQSYQWPWWHGTHMPFFWWIFPLMFFIVIILLVFFMLRRGGMGCMWSERMTERSSESALDILNKRYAKGEIDKQQYEEIKAAISGSK